MSDHIKIMGEAKTIITITIGSRIRIDLKPTLGRIKARPDKMEFTS
jgi:hypothetical protein